MSSIDERVVQMTFDNDQFHEGVNESLKDLEALRSALKLDDMQKSLSALEESTKHFSMDELASTVTSALSKMGVGAASFITTIRGIKDALSDAASWIERQFSKSLQSVRSGFEEYELQMNSVQTITANVAREGKGITDVNKALGELNEYADQTIYNFQQMTSNIGKFTAAGVGLEDSVAAIKGASNLAAFSGADPNEFARAMYQLSQGMASGALRLQDWRSIENASMGTKQFQEQLMQTARVHGVAIDEMIEKNGSFQYSLQENWLTSEILLETLKQYTGDLSDEQLRSIGYTDEQIQQINQLAENADKAAREIKTVTQLFDTIAESEGSGWTQTWQILIGDMEQAKQLLSGIYDVWDKIIQTTADRRNNFLREVMDGKPVKSIDADAWSSFAEASEYAGELEEAVIEVARAHDIAIDDMIAKEGSFAATLKNGWLSSDLIEEALGSTDEAAAGMAHSLEDLQSVVDQVLNGEWGTGEDRLQKLTEAGWDYATVQGLVNEMVWNGSVDWENLTDEQLASLGATEEQISRFKELKEQLGDSSSAISQLISEGDTRTGRELILSTVEHVTSALSKFVDVAQAAWDEIFPPQTADGIRSILQSIESLAAGIDELDFSKVQKVFEGVFSVLATIKEAVGFVFGFSGDVISEIWSRLFPSNAETSEGESKLDKAVGIAERIIELRSSWKEAMESFPSASEVVDSLVESWGNLLDFLDSKGINASEIISKVTSAFAKFGEIRDKIASKVKLPSDVDSFIPIFEKMRSFLDLVKSKIPSVNFDKFNEFFRILREGASEKVLNGIDGIKDFFSGKSFDFSWFTKITDSFKTLIASFSFEEFHPIQQIKEILSGVFDGFDGFSVDFSGILEFIQSLFNDFTSLFDENEGILGPLKELWDEFDSIFSESSTASLKDGTQALAGVAPYLSAFFDELKTAFGAFIGDTTLKDVLKWIKDMVITLATFKGIGNLRKLFEGLGGAAEAIKKAADTIGSALITLGGNYKAGKEADAKAATEQVRPLETLGTLILKIGATFALVGVGTKFIASALNDMVDIMKKVNELNSSELQIGIGVVAALEGLLTGFVLAVNAASKGTTAVKELAEAATLQLMVDALDDMVDIVAKIVAIEGDPSEGVSIIGGLELLLGTFAGAMAKVSSGIDIIRSVVEAGLLKLYIRAIEDMVDIIVALSNPSLDEDGMNNAVGIVAAAEILLGTFAGAMSKVYANSSGIQEILNAGSLLLMTTAIEDMTDLLTKVRGLEQFSNFDKAIGVIASAEMLLGLFAGCLSKISANHNVFDQIIAAGTLLIMVTAIGDMTDLLIRFRDIPLDETSLVNAVGWIGSAEALLGGFALALSVAADTGGGIDTALVSAALSLMVDSIGDMTTIVMGFVDSDYTLGEVTDAVTKVGEIELLLGAFAGILSKVGGFNTLLGGVSVDLIAEGVNTLVDALIKFAEADITFDTDHIIAFAEAIAGLVAVAAITSIAPVQAGLAVLAASISAVLFSAGWLFGNLSRFVESIKELYQVFADNSDDPTADLQEFLQTFLNNMNGYDFGKAAAGFIGGLVTGLAQAAIDSIGDLALIGVGIATSIGSGLNDAVDQVVSSIADFVQWFGDAIFEAFGAGDSEARELFDGIIWFLKAFFTSSDEFDAAAENLGSLWGNMVMKAFINSIHSNEVLASIWDGIADMINFLGGNMYHSDEYQLTADGSWTIVPRGEVKVDTSGIPRQVADQAILAGAAQKIRLEDGTDMLVEIPLSEKNIQFVYEDYQAGDMWLTRVWDTAGNLIQGDASPDNLNFEVGIDLATVKEQGSVIGEHLMDGGKEAIEEGGDALHDAAKGSFEEGVDGANEGAGTQSPSWKTALTGFYMIQGAVLGMTKAAPVFVAAIKLLMENAIRIMDSYRDKPKETGLAATTSLASGFTEGTFTVASAVTTMATSIKNGIKYELDDLSDIGYNAVAGIARGISNGSSLAIDAARNMAVETLNAAKNALQVASPSRRFEREVGLMIPRGTARGILKGFGAIDDAAESMGEKSIKAVRSVLQSMDKEIDDDAWSPRITPVVDLSNVENASRYINAAFGVRGAKMVASTSHALASTNMQRFEKEGAPVAANVTNVYVDGAIVNDDQAIHDGTLSFLYALKRKAAL